MEDLYARLQNRDPQAFEQLATALVSRDNVARKAAEDFYQQLLSQNPDVVIMFLGSGLSSSQAELKHFCCLYLRKARSLEQRVQPVINRLFWERIRRQMFCRVSARRRRRRQRSRPLPREVAAVPTALFLALPRAWA